MEPLEVYGEPPRLAGLRCDAIFCQQYWHGGRLLDPANSIYLCFDGLWHRLYFDYGMIFWRTDEGEPEPYEAPEIDAAYPVVDVAEERGLRGVTLLDYRMEQLEHGSQVTFAFENGVGLAFRYLDDVTTYGDA